MRDSIDFRLDMFEEKAKSCVLEFFEDKGVPFGKEEEKDLSLKIRKCAEGYFGGRKSPHGLDSEERNYACDICGIIEDILEEKDITIPDDSREDYEEDEEDLARLFGDAYYEMEDLIAALFEEAKADAGRKVSFDEQVVSASGGRPENAYLGNNMSLDR